MDAAPGGAASAPPVLLADALWWGTLSAVRDLGRRGIPVTVASDSAVAPARWSKHLRRFVRCPPTADLDRFLSWLLDFGRRQPGHVLCATSDETAWCYAVHRQELSRWFRFATPTPDALAKLLDKALLLDAGRTAGLDVGEKWCPESVDEARAVGAASQVPLFVKPRAQLFAIGAGKGERVEGAAALARVWEAQRRGVTYHPQVRARVPGIEFPIIQAYQARAERIYTVDGFIDPGGEFVARACVKLLQRPRGSGPGIVFEDAPLLEPVARGLRTLFLSVGFHGPFDVEFLEDGDRRLLIDVNPRFYNHMAFEVDRGLPLPWLSYLLAAGEHDALRTAIRAAAGATGGPRLYVHRLPLKLMAWAQRILGRLSAEKRRAFNDWLERREETVTDPADAPGDSGPARAAYALELVSFLVHPRSYLRALARVPARQPELHGASDGLGAKPRLQSPT